MTLQPQNRPPFLPVPRLALALALAGGLQMPSYAQQDGEQSRVDEIVVVSSQVPQPLRRIGISVSVLDESDIQARGSSTLVDVLRQLPGVAASNGGGAGQPTSLRIRGEEGFRTLTLLDGIRLSDPSTPQVVPQLEHHLSSGVGRVEVLRGPQGLSYGADAGGVVSISTRRPAETGLALALDAQAGAFGTRQSALNLSGASAGADFFLSLLDFSTEGFNAQAADSELRDDDGYDNRTLHARLGLALAEGWRLEATQRATDGETSFDGCFAGILVHDCLADYALQASRLVLSRESEGVSQSLAYASTTTERESFALGSASFAARGELERWEYLASVRTLPGVDLVLGADHEEARSDGSGRDNLGVHAELLSDFSDRLFLSAGLRHDDNDDFGSNLSHRLSAAYLIELDSGTLKLKASQGTGFRAPSPYEIAYNAGAFAYPPASLTLLEQETSRGYEAGVEYVGHADLHLEVVYFDQKVEDAIFFDLAGFSGYLQESGTSESSGVEVLAEAALSPHWRLSGTYTYNDSELPDGEPRLRRPEHLLNAGLSFHALQDRLQLHAFYRRSRNTYDELAGDRLRLDDFGVLDLSASYRLTTAFQLHGRIENLGGEDYEEIAGYPAPGRAAYFGFRLELPL